MKQSAFAMSATYPNSQKGMVLLVGLVMVLLMTMVGLAAIRGSGLQETMAGNMRDRNLAFQSAESVLRSGEEMVSDANKNLPEFMCVAGGTGFCSYQNTTGKDSIPYWDAKKWDDIGKTVSFSSENVSSPPRYVVEELYADIKDCAISEGSAIDVAGMASTGDCTPFRISGRGFGVSTDAEVVLQSTYKRRYK